MLVARNEEAHRELARMVKAREVVREYTALVEGRLGSRTGTIDAPLGRHRRQRTKRAVKGAGSREARTHFEVIEALPADTLVHARLETGRTHQIRVHFAAIGHPVAGDPEYGTRGRHGLERQFLHASRLRVQAPQHRRGAGVHLGAAGRSARRTGKSAQRPELAGSCGIWHGSRQLPGGAPSDAGFSRSAPTIPRTLHPTPAERHGTLPGHARVPAAATGQPNNIKR